MPLMVRVAGVLMLAGVVAWVAVVVRGPRMSRLQVAVGGRDMTIERAGDGPDVLVLSADADLSRLAPFLARRHRVTVAPAALVTGADRLPLSALVERLGIAGSVRVVAAPGDLPPLLREAPPARSRGVELVAMAVGRHSVVTPDLDVLVTRGADVFAIIGPSSPLWHRLRGAPVTGGLSVALVAACDQDLDAACAGETARLLDATPRRGSLSTGQMFRDTLRAGGEGPSMIVVPTGQFWANATGDAPRVIDRLSGHAVRVSVPVAVARTETTVAEFRRFVEATGHRPDSGCWYHTVEQEWKLADHASWSAPGFPQSDEHPVTCVSFDDATAYATWLGAETAHVYRLPTDAEFEFVNRGGRYGEFGVDDGPGGLCDRANGADRASALAYASACDDGYAATSPVGRFGVNDFGLADTTGNVWELTSDCSRMAAMRVWDELLAARWPAMRSTGRSCPGRHVVRGGAFLSSPANLRVQVRDLDGYRSNRIGFRLVRELR